VSNARSIPPGLSTRNCSPRLRRTSFMFLSKKIPTPPPSNVSSGNGSCCASAQSRKCAEFSGINCNGSCPSNLHHPQGEICSYYLATRALVYRVSSARSPVPAPKSSNRLLEADTPAGSTLAASAHLAEIISRFIKS